MTMPLTHADNHTALEPLPRRILMTTDAIGGVWTYALDLCRGLSEFGVEVALATMGQPLTAPQRREAADEENVTLYESCFRLEWMDDPWDDVRESGEWLLSLEAKLRPDLVHLNGYAHAALPWSAPCLVVGHSCVLSWWEAVRHEEPPATLDPYRQSVVRGLAGADLVVAPSSAMMQALERIYKPLPNGRVIYNARGRTRFSPGRKKEFILSVGRLWDDAKNIGTLARTAYRLPWPIYVAGEQKHPGGGTAAFDGVNRLGFLSPEALAPWYSAAAVYAFPARYEPFGLTVLEAALSGCALVLGDIPTFRELWDDAAIFVDPEDEEELARELRTLCMDSTRLSDSRERARLRSRAFNLGKMTAGYLAAYRDLVPRRQIDLDQEAPAS
ncbi:glycosyltransferase family 4 protein [Geomonas sp. Red276]